MADGKGAGYNPKADYNKDGKVTPKEQARFEQGKAKAKQDALAKDKLEMSQLASMGSVSANFVRSNSELLKLFRTAIKEDWLDSEQGKANFMSAFERTAWYQENNEWARKYLVAKNAGGADFKEQLKVARAAVQQEAVRIGADLNPEALDFFTEQFLMNGWGESGRQGFLAQALTGEYEYEGLNGTTEKFDASFLNYGKGGAAATINALKQTAKKNGVSFSEDYFNGAARAVMSGMGSIEDYMAEIRKHGASAMPLYADRILAGEDAYDIASPWINKMAQVLEIDPATIDLSDPYIKAALGAVDEKGNPTGMGFWDFEKSLRKDARWAYTKQANDEVSSIVGKIGSMMGFGGSM